MVPSGFVQLLALPLTPSGKVDRRALCTEAYAPPEQRVRHVPPRNDVEQCLADIWSEVLGVSSPGVHDDFFDLGGDSLLATQAVSRARRAFEVDLAIRQLFSMSTIADLAQAIDGLRWAIEGSDQSKPGTGAMREQGVL